MDAGSPSTSWNTPEVGYFIPDNSFRRHGQLKHMETGKDLIPRFYNAHAFVNHLRALLILKNEATIRANIYSCLRGDALEWYDTELTNTERIELNVLPLDQGWFDKLLQRFEPPYEISLFRVETSGFDYDVPACQAARNFMRHAQALGIEGTKRQLTRIWECLQNWRGFAGQVAKPRSGTSISDFMREIDVLEQSRMYEDHETGMDDQDCDGGFGDWYEWWSPIFERFNNGEEVDAQLLKFLENRQKNR